VAHPVITSQLRLTEAKRDGEHLAVIFARCKPVSVRISAVPQLALELLVISRRRRARVWRSSSGAPRALDDFFDSRTHITDSHDVDKPNIDKGFDDRVEHFAVRLCECRPFVRLEIPRDRDASHALRSVKNEPLAQ
jgi:hypothetical protein